MASLFFAPPYYIRRKFHAPNPTMHKPSVAKIATLTSASIMFAANIANPPELLQSDPLIWIK